MKTRHFLLLTVGWLACISPVLADRMPLPKDSPPSYQQECASCHLAFPPALLNARDWQQTLQQLDRHFGSDVTVAPARAREIAAFLERNAGAGKHVEGAGKPPRITQTARFVRKHREIPGKYWRDRRIRSAANCEACHGGASKGHFSEHDILIPELRD